LTCKKDGEEHRKEKLKNKKEGVVGYQGRRVK
jgi:hypothetical protein